MVLAALLTVSACQKNESPKLRFATWGSVDEVAVIKTLLIDFEKENPNTPVELVHIPDNYFQKIHLMIASGTVPDVLFLNNFNLPIYADSGVLLDLAPYLGDQKKDFFPQPLDAMSWKGTLYGIPRDISNLVMYLNLDLFKAAGLQPPPSNWGWDQALSTAKALTKDTDGDGQRDQFGVSFDPRPLFWLPYLWSWGGDLFSSDFKKSGLSTPQALQGLQFYTDLRHRHHVAPTEQETGNAKMAQLFMQGKLGMFLSGRWSVPGFRKNLTFDWDVAPFPHGPAGSVVDVDASGWAIAKSSRQPEKAWKLISFLSGRKASEVFASDGLIVPARRDVADSPLFLSKDQKPKNSQIFLDVVATGRPTRTTPNWNEISVEMDQGLEKLWRGTLSPTEALPKTANRLNELLR